MPARPRRSGHAGSSNRYCRSLQPVVMVRSLIFAVTTGLSGYCRSSSRGSAEGPVARRRGHLQITAITPLDLPALRAQSNKPRASPPDGFAESCRRPQGRTWRSKCRAGPPPAAGASEAADALCVERIKRGGRPEQLGCQKCPNCASRRSRRPAGPHLGASQRDVSGASL